MHTMASKSGLKSILLSVVLTITVTICTGFHSDKILLSDVKALTLHHGQMTSARRSAPVPQLKCVGGGAQGKFVPKVVQCTNKGSDGYDIQWECKTDMDNAYRFGRVEVTCEGYDYPNDPYILKGSCGLEYELEFTEEGIQREKQKGTYGQKSYQYKSHSEGGGGGLFFFGAILVAMYVIYKTCLAPNNRTNGTQPNQQPPPYGFRPEYMPDQGPSAPPPPYDDSWSNPDPGCGNTYSHQSHTYPNTASMGPGGGGFWTGAATGGLMGYLFGRGTGNNHHHRGYGGSTWGSGHTPSYNSGSNSGGGFFSSSNSSSGSSSSGTRTASGFGGTSRR